MKAQVCVSGIGVVAPNGIGKEAFWHSLRHGISGISRISLFDPKELKAQIAGEVRGFNEQELLSKPFKTNRMARHTKFALVAADEALADAGLPLAEAPPDYPVPIVMGVGTSACDVLGKNYECMMRRGLKGALPTTVDAALPQAPAAAISEYVDVNARVLTMSSACAAGLDAIAHAMELIESERTDIAIAGGTDAPITPLSFASFSAAGLASSRNDSPETASRPFDRERDTGVISEGAGVVVLENLEHALARGATPYMLLSGYSVQRDPSRAPAPATGLGMTMEQAMNNAGKRPTDIDYICAHGPSHPTLDLVETTMIKQALSRRAYAIPVSSIKGVLGNPLSAAGPLQVAACGLALRAQQVPPTANYEFPDPKCDLDYVPKEAREQKLDCAMINAHGVGGGNTSMVVERVA